jgi:plasmid stability protein
MAGNLSIRHVDDDLIVDLKRRAATNGRSGESEIREIPREAVERGEQHEVTAGNKPCNKLTASFAVRVVRLRARCAWCACAPGARGAPARPVRVVRLGGKAQ